jgi:hypothetical protein
VSFWQHQRVLVTSGRGFVVGSLLVRRFCALGCAARERFGFSSKMTFAEGPKRTVEWYLTTRRP